MEEASDSMAAGVVHVLWGWRPNVLGEEMARLLEAGNHCGATYEEVKAFADAALGALPPTVTLGDGSKAVLLGLAAHRSIDTGMPVMWSDMLAEFGEAQARLGGVGAAV